ncbi:MAG TPA: hypothetical protein VGB03_03430 [Acidimicrobiales bacterium]
MAFTLPALLARGAAAGLFGLLSKLRGKRVFHPVGSAYEATVTFDADVAVDAELFRRPGPHRAVVRLSRGLGLPDSLPDVLGLAVKVPDAYGPGRDQDFLFATSGRSPAGRHLLVPTRDVRRRPYSTLLFFRIGEDLFVLGAFPEEGEPLRFRLAAARATAEWVPVGRVEVGAELPAEVSECLRFNPANTSGGIALVGPLNRLRDPAYRASQDARPTPDAKCADL